MEGGSGEGGVGEGCVGSRDLGIMADLSPVIGLGEKQLITIV